MILYPDCDYFNEERDNQYAPLYGECEECYRYDICRRAKTLAELLSGKIVKLNFSDLSKLIWGFPSEINTLMIQKSFDGYYIIVDDITIRKEQERKAIKIEL